MKMTHRSFKLLATSAAVFVLAGCASLTPEVLSQQEIESQSRADLKKRMAEIAPISDAITIEEAIARALKYNLDHRAKSLEMALASGQLEGMLANVVGGGAGGAVLLMIVGFIKKSMAKK